ncbi:hypothetical protein HN51_057586, partial [Arachis hypogaea]
MNYTLIIDNHIVGSQPQKPEDIDHLKKEEGVTYILNLQQDKDVEYWGIDLKSITRRCHELDVRHMRRPAIDFDPNSLQNILPKASYHWNGQSHREKKEFTCIVLLDLGEHQG